MHPFRPFIQAILLCGLAGAVIPACGGSEAPVEKKEEGEPVKKIGENRYEVRKGWLAGLADEKAWTGAAASAALVAADDNGAHGLRVGAKPGSALVKLGLVSGDLLRAVDGKPAEDPAAAMALLEGLGGAANFTLEVIRKGQPQTFIYEVR